jgi:hypothetical protein
MKHEEEGSVASLPSIFEHRRNSNDEEVPGSAESRSGPTRHPSAVNQVVSMKAVLATTANRPHEARAATALSGPLDA